MYTPTLSTHVLSPVLIHVLIPGLAGLQPASIL